MSAEPLERLGRLLVREEGQTVEHRATLAARKLQATRKALSEFVREVGRSGDLPLIVATEKAIIAGDLDRYANSPMMSSSLRTAIAEIAVIEKHIGIVDDPARYQSVDEAHSLPRNRRGALPYDEARQALASHYARLDNMDKARSDDDEKQFISARKAAFKEAGKLYAVRQAKTLGAGA